MDSLLSPQKELLKNWSGNLIYGANKVYTPGTVEEVRDIVKANNYINALGTRHCFNGIADNQYNFLSTANLNKVISLDEQNKTVMVEAGIKYGELAPWLHQKGYALHNLASLPHISVGGSIATGTHGSGINNGNLSSAVTGLELVTAGGGVQQLSKATDAERLNAAVVGLGALGIVTKVKLSVVPTYEVSQWVYLGLPISALEANFEAIMSAGYSVSLFTNWVTEVIDEVWVKEISDSGASSNKHRSLLTRFNAQPANYDMHPIPGISAVHCTEQMGVPGPWHERLPHFKMGFTPSSGDELQSEYFVPIVNAVDAIYAVARLGKMISPYLLTSEIRTIAADDLWMSPCYKQASVAIHFTWKPNWPEVKKLLPIIEKELSPYKARPHWGKLFTMQAEVLRSRYEKLDDFISFATKCDPNVKFRNDFLKHYIFDH
ncbi:MAG: FAD-binding protein [Mucilaginibacter sp.]